MNRIWKIWGEPLTVEVGGLRVYYLVLLFLLGRDWPSLYHLTHNLDSADWLWPWRIFAAQQSEGGIFVTHILALVSFGLAAAWPRQTLFRVIAALLFSLTWSFQNSFGAVSHSRLVMTWAALFFCLPWARLGLGLSLARASVFSTYVISGLWKLRELSDWAHGQSIRAALSEHIAASYADDSNNNFAMVKALGDFPRIAACLWIAVIFMQLGFVWPILRPRWEKFFFVIALGFHLASQMLLGVYFEGQVLTLVMLFYVMREEKLYPPEPGR